MMDRLPPDHSNLMCRCRLETIEEHPPTAWGHLQPRTMGDPCPHCDGTEYYCAHMLDQVVGQENFDAVMKALSELYQEWCRVMREGPERSEIKYHSAKLMDAYNRWLG